MSLIVFRADASTAIGSGHVVRCATLASELVARGANVRFLCRELPGHYCDWLEQRGFGVMRLRGTAIDIDDDIEQCRAALANMGVVDWLAVDHYGLDVRWETALRPLAGHLFVIDDKAERPHDCDLLLDQNFTAGPVERYAGLLPPGAECLLGPRYALLRPEFAAARATRPARDGSVRRVLVCFGGSDPQGHTVATLHALRSYASRLERIDVAAGPANPHRTAIAAACDGLPNAVLHCPANNMAELLAGTDLAIGAGGTMSWERACLGVPTLAFGIAGNQRAILEALLEAGCLAGAAEMEMPGSKLIEGWLTVLVDNPVLLRGLATRSAALVDGHGTQRIAGKLLSVSLVFRPATPEDGANLLRWRNHPSIRAMSLDSGEICPQAHFAWLRRTLTDPQRILLIAEHNGEAAGVVRFDLAQPQALISVYRVPAADSHGGLIRQASDWLHRQHPEIRRIVAEILPDNGASLAAFRAAGYRDAKNILVIELD